jgi:hypothetical protein
MKAKQFQEGVVVSKILRLTVWAAMVLACWACPWARAAGTWTALTNRSPDAVNTMLLLPDGTVLAADANDEVTWYRLTPDIHGSYLNGTWTTNAAMHDSRLYYSSDVLTNGRMFVAGAEYGTGGASGEIYDPLLNTWTMITSGAGQIYYDQISVVLPDSTILMSPVFPSQFGQTAVYNPETGSWPLFPELFRGNDQDEASWVMLPDNSILTVDSFTNQSERYIPSDDKWVNDAVLPVALYDTNLGEEGPFFLLANSNVFCIGNTGNTALYTPSGTTNAGSWIAGPAEPAGLGAPDAPGAVEADGEVLFTLGYATNYNAPTFFFEYDPVANAINPVAGPGSLTNDNAPYVMRMLDLPDGGVLFSYSNRRLYEYQPTNAPLASGRPTITSVTTNYYRSYHLTGTLLNGISQGAAYGDDAQMNSNYPLVRMTNSAGNVYYARTYNWSSTCVMTGSLPVTTEFMAPQNLPAGVYSLVVVANGISSAPVSLTFAPDTLQISALTGFAAVGPFSGPVAAQSASFTLTNMGTSSLNWSVGNIPAWLNVSNSSGTLTNSGSTTTVIISLNTNGAAAQPVGNYAATVWFTNVTTGAIQGVPFGYQSTPLVVNGGFEYGSTAFWTLSGASYFSSVGCVGASSYYTNFIHSGFFAAVLGYNSGGGPGYISQTIPTVAGARYNLSFWLNNLSDVTTNIFMVTWNGSNIFNQANLGSFSFSNFQFTVYGASNHTVLQFGFDDDTNYFGLDDVVLTAQSPPTIAVPPANQTVAVAGTATFTVQAAGVPPFYYQWLFDGVMLAKATNSTLTLTDISTNQGGSYAAIVTNAFGSVTSSPPAILTVLAPSPPTITVQPGNQTVPVPGTASFTVQAIGAPPLYYQWDVNGTNLASATNTTLTLTNLTTNQGGFYTVIVTNPYGSVTSSPSILTVLPASILLNGGFETGNFSDWTLSGNTNGTIVVESSPYNYLGEFGVQAGPVGSPVYISQALATAPGQAYVISCWVSNPEGATPNEFLITWNGTNLVNQTNISATNWINLQAAAVATGPSSILAFVIQDNPGYLGLDDISVSPLPQPSFLTVKPNAGLITFQWSALAGLGYQLQYTSDLRSNSWSNLGGAIIAFDTVLTATDSPTNSQRFYRLLLLP